MKAAALQMVSGADLRDNLAAAGRLLARARAAGATLAVLPENFAFMGAQERDKLAHAEADGRGPIQDFLAGHARELGLAIVGGTIPLAAPGEARVRAACLVYGPDGARRARYDKIHLFDVEVGEGERYRESATIAPGEPVARVVEAAGVALGLSVCYDLRFPELYRALAAGGAQVLAVPAAFTERTGRAHWHLLLRARAVENACFVVAPGQAGLHPGGRRTFGHSLIVDPWGEVLAEAAAEGEALAVAELDLARLRQIRTSFPVLDHRRL